MQVTQQELVNTYQENHQDAPEVRVLADGSYVIVWDSEGQDGASTGVYGQRFSASGVPIGAEFRINTFTEGTQSDPHLTALSNGGFVVTWTDTSGPDGSSQGVMSQRYDASGVPNGGNTLVNTTTNSVQYQSAAVGYDGGYAVVWTSFGNTNGDSYDIYVQRFDNAGVPVGLETRVSTTPGNPADAQNGAQYEADVAAYANGNLVIVWEDHGSNDGSSYGVYGRTFNAAAGTFSDTFLINTYTTGAQYESSVATLSDGGFVVVWRSDNQDGSSAGVYAQRFDSTGAKAGGEFLVNQTTNGGQYQPEVTGLSTGGFVVTWFNDNYDTTGSGSYSDVYVREYAADGTPLTSQQKLTTPGNGSDQQSQPTIADLGNGNYVVSYMGYNSTAAGGNNTYEVFQQLFGSAAELPRQANPELGDFTGTVTFAENLVNSTPQVIDPAVSLTDADSANFDGGQIDLFYVQYGEATDQLGVRNQGSGGGQIGVSGSTVSYGGTTIGTLSGGTNGSNLMISLNADATVAAVEALIQNLTYASNSESPAATRTVGIRVSDGDGGASASSTVTINVTLELDGVPAVHGQERANTYVTNSQDAPEIAVLTDGSYVIVWDSEGQDGSSTGVYGQRFSASGVAIGGEFRVNVVTDSTQSDAHIAALSSGGFVVTWTDVSGVDGSGQGIIAQRYDAAGVAQGGNVIVNASTSSTQYQSAVASYSGGYAVVWSSAGNLAGDSYDIYLQRFDNAGGTVGGETRVSTTPGNPADAQNGAQYEADVAAYASGNLVIVWEDSSGNDGSGYGVYGRTFNATTSTFSDTFLINSYTSGSQYEPSVATLSDGGFIVVWRSDNQDGSSAGVYGQRYDAAGVKVGGEFLVNERTTGGQYQPEVTGLSSGGFVVTWYNDNYDLTGAGSYNDVYIREYDASGTAIDGERKLETPGNGSDQQSQPTIADLGSGNFVVAYAGYNSTAAGGNNTQEIFQQLFGTAAELPRQANPELGDFTGTVTFGENLVNATPQVIDAAVSLSDADSANFGGGRVDLFYVQYGEATDQLGVRNQGAGAGQIGVSGNAVSFSGTTIGTIVGGTNGSNLTINLNAAATVEAVEALVQNLTYGSTSESPAASRTVGIRVSDGDGGATESSTVTINVTPELDGAPVAYAQERVNHYTASGQDTPEIAVLTDGSYVIVWDSEGQDGSSTGIYGQRFTASGVVLGNEFRINSAFTSTQYDVHVAALSNGGFVVTWTDTSGIDGSGQGIIAQRYDASGVAQGSNVIVNASTSSTQYQSAVASYTDGYAIVWTSVGNVGGDSYDIYLQRFDNGGGTVGGETRVSTTPGNAADAQNGSQHEADVAAYANGNLVIVWEDTGGNDGSSYGVYGRTFNATTSTFSDTFLINSYTSGTQYEPSVATLSDGGFIVVWRSDNQDGSSAGVYGQRYDAAGVKVGGEFLVNERTSGGQYQPEVTGLSSGGFVVTWYNDNYDVTGTGSYGDVYIREYDASGAAIDGERKLATPGNGSDQQTQPTIADLGNGNFVVAYTGYNSTAAGGNNTNEIFQQIFGSVAEMPRTSTAPVLDDLRAQRILTNALADPFYAGNALSIDADVGVYDIDSANFDGGQLVVSLLNGAAASEALAIRNQGTGAFQIGVSGSDVTLAGTVIGTFTGGGAGVDRLTITLNANADAMAVRALTQQITYQNTAPPSGTTNRYIGFSLSDGDGAVSNRSSTQLTIQNTFTPTPVFFEDLESSITISETAANAGVILDDAVQLNYGGTTGFNGGTLLVSYLSSSSRPVDQLSIQNQGSGTTQIGVSGSAVSYQGVVIGTISDTLNGANGASLQVTFNASATDQAIEYVIENLIYRNLSEGPNPERTIRVQVRDGDNVASTARDMVINITPETDPGGATFLFGEVQTNSYEAGNQNSPVVTRLLGGNDGGYVIAWVSEGGQDGEQGGIFAQRYNALGAAEGPEFQVNSQTLGDQNEAAIGGLQDGGFVIAWRSSYGEDGSGYGVYAQRFGADGQAAGSQFQVNSSTLSSQYEPAVLGLADGSFVITYRSDYSNAAGTYSYDVLGQRYAADGSTLGAEFAVNTLVSGTQFQPQLSALAGGGFVAVWTDTNGDASGYGIVAQRFAADGSKVGGEIPVNTTTTSTQQGPDVAGLAGGGFVAVWHYASNVYAQRFDALGAKLGSEFIVSTSDAPANYNAYARVAALDDGGFAVTWDGYNVSGIDILTQRYDAAGNKVDGALLVNTTTASTQYQPDIAALGGNNFVVAWAGYNQEIGGTTSTYGVFHQLLGEAGSISRSEAPVLVDMVSAVSFDEALVNVTPQLIDPGVALTDSDSANFDGGRLWVSVISGYGDITYAQLPEDVRAQDQLGIRSTGDLAGQVSVSGTTVSYGGTAIGTVEFNGVNGNDLIVRFNANANAQAVEAVIESLTYGNTSSAPVATRTISISVSDGDGGTSAPRVVTVNVIPDFDGAQPLFTNERVNTYSPGTQDEQSIARLADGGYVIVWTSTNQDGWSDGVFGQRYDAVGVPVGNEFQINSYTPNQQSTPAVAGLSGGGFVVMWHSNGQDGSSWGIQGQRFDANGAPVGAEFLVNTQTDYDQSEVDVASLPGGGFVAVWNSYYQDGRYYDIYMQRFDAAGNKVGAETRANVSTGFESNYQATPLVASFSDGSYVVVWRSDAEDGDGAGIYGRRFNADGSANGGEFRVNTYTTNYQYEPDVTVLNGGGFVVVWRSDGQDGSAAGVFGQRYAADGSAVGSEFRVNTDTSGNEYQPSVSALTTGGFVVTWNDDSRTFVQQFDASGARVDNAMRVDMLDNNSNANLPVVQGLDNGAFVVAWRDYDYNSGGTYEVYQQLFGNPGDFVHSANPELVDVRPLAVFAENTINTTPQLIDPGVGLFDPDSSDFDGGILEVNYLTGYGAQDQLGMQGLGNQDQLGIRNQGSGVGEVAVSGTAVSYEGVLIGSILSNGANGAKLTVLFNASATSEAVERVIENLTYANTVSNPIASRTISIRVSDGDGGASVAQTVEIRVTPEIDGAVPEGLEKSVNTTTANSQEEPSVGRLYGANEGGYVVVWQSYSQDVANTWGVYGQRYDADDNPAGSEFRVNTETASSQYEAQVVGLTGGGFVVVWRSDGQDGSSAGVYAQRYDVDGVAAGSEFRVNTTTAQGQYQPTVTASSDGGFVVSWFYDYYNASFTEYADIFFQRYDASGGALGGETRANPAGEGNTYQYQPSITWLEDGGFVVVWSDNSGKDGAGTGVFGQVFNASGVAQGAAFQVNSHIDSTQDTPEVAALKDGGFVVVWESAGQDLSSTGVYAQRFALDGSKVGAEFRVNTTISSTQYQPTVTGLENGGWVVAWTDIGGAGNSYDIFLQQYNAAGQPVDGETRANTYNASTQYQPSIVSMADGGFVVAYSSYTYSGDGDGDGVPDGGSDSHDIRLQRFSNTAPEITDVQVTGAEDSVIVLSNTLFEAGFNDPDGQSLQAVKIVTLPGNGVLKLNGVDVLPAQEISIADLQANLLTYQGDTDYFGLDQFRWTGSDGIAFASTSVFTNITLSNVNDGPRLEAGADDTANEGTFFSHTITIGDPDPEGHLITVNWGDGKPNTVFSTSASNPSISHYFDDDGSYTVTVTVNDQQGQPISIETDTFNVTVANVAPTISLFGNNSVEQGVAYVLDLGFPNDPGTDTVSEYRIDWGDGTAVQVIAAGDLPANREVTHTYSSAGAKAIAVALVDEDGTFSNAGTKSVAVSAPAEVITVNAGADIGVSEGSFFQKTITFNDPADQDPAGRSYTVDWGDGSTSNGNIAGGASSFVIGHTYADNTANYDVTVTVDDSGAQQGSDTFSVAVNNVAPTISLGGNGSVSEGSAYVLTLNAPVDPGDDTVSSYVIHWGDGSEQTIAAADLPANRQVSHVYADGAQNLTISVDLVDEDGTWLNAGSRSIQINNVAPAIDLTGAASVNEGASYTLSLGAITDPGQDTATSYQINWGDGTFETFTAAQIATNPDRTHIYADGANDYTIFVSVTDEDGVHTNAGNKQVTVNNVAPEVVLAGVASIDEGGSYALTITGSDAAGAADPLSYSINWGDGSAVQNLTAAELAGLGGVVSHVFTDDQNGIINATDRTIAVTANDGDGGETTVNRTVTVNNVAPTMSVSGADSADEGSAYVLSLGSLIDPGADTVTAYSIDWGDGTVQSFTAVEFAALAGSTSHVYADGAASRTIEVSGTDEDGTFVLGSKSLTVNNVAPEVVLAGAASIDEGGSYALTITGSDAAGAADPLSYSIDWGDGSAVQNLTAAELAGLGGVVSHVFADDQDGIINATDRTIAVTANDGDGGETTVNRTVTVNNVAPTIALSGAATVIQGTSYTLTLGGVTDPGDDTVSSYVVAWGDGSTDTYAAAGDVTHSYASTGAFDISVTLIDEDGSFADAGTAAVEVTAASATLSFEAGGNASVAEGGTFTRTINFSDGEDNGAAGWTYEVDYGDGTVETGTTPTMSLGLSHVYADGDANRTVTVTLTDEAGETATDSFTVAVSNVAPTMSVSGADSVNEGSAYVLSLGSLIDPGADTVTAYSIDWGDGTVQSFTAGEFAALAGSTSHVYADGAASRTIEVSGTDEDGTFVLGSKSLTVNNVAPEVVLAGAASIDEGGSYALTITGSDAAGAADPLSYSINWGDGSAVQNLTAAELAGLGGVVSHVFADDQDGIINATNRTIAVTANDGDGGETTVNRTVTVNNVAPTIALSGAATVIQGTSYTLTLGAVTDPGDDTVSSYVVDWGDGSTDTYATAGDVTHSYASTGDFDISVTLIDEDGSFADAGTATVEVTAASATLSFEAGGNASVSEGGTFTRTINFSDGEDNGAAGWTYEVDYGDGTVETGTTPTMSLGLSHVYADGDANRTVTVTLTDEAGETATDSFTVAVSNVVPTMSVSGADSADEGSAYVLSLGSLIDPGADTVTAYSIDWGDGTVQSFTAGEFAALAGSTSHVYADGAASRTIEVSGTDEDGTFVLGSKSLTVNNVAPTIALSGAATSPVGMSYVLALGALVDPGDDTVSGYVIDWGDGNTTSVSTADPVAHTYNATGSFTISVAVTDEDGEHGNAGSLDVDIFNTAPDAVEDSYDATAGIALGTENLLSNDSDGDGHGFQIVSYDYSGSGTLVVEANGQFSYAAASGFSGVDTFTYTIRDNFGAEDTATVSLTVSPQVEVETVRVGDAPVRVSLANLNAISDAWFGTHVAAIVHKADVTNAAEAWSAVSFGGVNTTTLAGVDHFSGDLGVSGQSMATSSVRQEIDGREALRFDLDQAATKVTVDLSRFYISDDGSAYVESGRLRVLDSGGNVVGESVFTASAASGEHSVSLELAGGFTAVEFSAGAYDGTDFIFGGYADAGGDFATAAYADGAGKMHGSDFMLDWVEFEFPVVPVIGVTGSTDPFA